MNTWHFGIENDKLVELVLNGKKTATTSLYDIDRMPQVGEQSILIYNNEKKACITEVKQVIIRKFKDIDWSLALLEGENNCLEEWKKIHRDYFSTVIPDFNDDTQIIFEIFEVVEDLTLKRLETARKIVDSNKKYIWCKSQYKRD